MLARAGNLNHAWHWAHGFANLYSPLREPGAPMPARDEDEEVHEEVHFEKDDYVELYDTANQFVAQGRVLEASTGAEGRVAVKVEVDCVFDKWDDGDEVPMLPGVEEGDTVTWPAGSVRLVEGAINS